MKILALDIETSPALTYAWDLSPNGRTPLSMVKDPGGVLCFAAQWVEHPDQRAGRRAPVFFYSTFKDGWHDMVVAAHALLDEADVVIHYNGKRFDIPRLNGAFVEAGLTPPSPYHQIDLWLTARRLGFISSKLEHVSERLGLAGKVKHEGFALWEKCLAGDPAAWRRMERYNKQDVRLLLDVHDILLPWITDYPNRRLYDGDTAKAGELVCSRCGGRLKSNGLRHTKVSTYRRYYCLGCGAWSRSTKRITGDRVTDLAA